MKVRIAVGLALALFAIGMLVCTGYGYEEVMTIPVVLLSVICVHEILGISGCKNKVMTRLMMLFSAGLDVFICLQLGRYLPFSPLILVGIYVLAVLILMLKMYDITRFEHVASGLVASIAVSLSLSSVHSGSASRLGKYVSAS